MPDHILEKKVHKLTIKGIIALIVVLTIFAVQLIWG